MQTNHSINEVERKDYSTGSLKHQPNVSESELDIISLQVRSALVNKGRTDSGYGVSEFNLGDH